MMLYCYAKFNKIIPIIDNYKAYFNLSKEKINMNNNFNFYNNPFKF